MSGWGDAFDEQCRAEGLEVPEKVESDQPNPPMEQNEENRGFKSAGIGRGGVFGGPSKPMNAPPPQTSFGATGARMGGSFGSQVNGPDGRGAPIGSDDAAGGGGNIISLGNHREKTACTFTRGGGFGTNRSMAPNSPTSFKTNYEGGRFGILAPKTTEEVTAADNTEKPKIGGSFGSSRSVVGGSFGSSRAVSSISRSSVGGTLGSASLSSDIVAEVESPRTFEASMSSNTQSALSSTAGGSFGSVKSNTLSGSIGGSFGSKMQGSVGGGFGSSQSRSSVVSGSIRSSTTGGTREGETSTNSSHGAPNTSIWRGIPIEQKSTSVGDEVSESSWGGVFVRKDSVPAEHEISESSLGGVSVGKTTKNTVAFQEPLKPVFGGVSSIRSSTSVSREAPATSTGATFNFSTTTGRSERIGGAFGAAARRVAPEIPDVSTPPPAIFGGGFGGNRSTDTSKSTLSRTTNTIGGGFGSGSVAKENLEPATKSVGFDLSRHAAPSNVPEVPPANPMSREENPFRARTMGRSLETRTFGGGIGTNKPPETPPAEEVESRERGPFGGFGTSTQEFTFRIKEAPFMGNQQPPPMRGGYQGGYRGRGSGGQMDFGAGRGGPSMGRGRGQPYVPQQRSTPPFDGPGGVAPDPKYKYSKAHDDSHEQAPIPADIALLNKFIQKEVKMMKDMVVDVQRQDPKSPLYSISSFRELRLKPEVLQALDNLNFQFPTRIQETALPLLLMEPPSNLIAQAQSGTGKTAAFVLTMLCRIDVNLPYPQCICLAPTLELAKQIGEVVEKMGAYMENLRIHYAIKGGNMAAMRGRKLTEQIVIGTPGITRDYLQKYKCIDPSKIRCLVLDEADVMIYHQGFTDISTTIYNMVEEESESVQSMLFSATYDEPVINFATKIIKNAIVVMLKREEQALPNIKQFYVQCACRDSKYAAIVNLYSGLAVASSVIFCHTKASVMWLFENMKARGHQVDVLHGDMTVVERADTIIRFKRGDFKVLITTNVFARGIDVAQVSVVINYDLPIKYDETGNAMVIDGYTQPDCETYLHRIGRTGRFGKTGIAINFIDSDDSMNMINVLENHFQMKIARMDPSNLVELEAIEMA